MRISDWSSDVCSSDLIAAVQYRGHIISLFIVQHPLVHSEARARYLSHPYARARRTPQMSAKISASRTRARYSRVSTAFPLIESANAASDWFNPSTVRSSRTSRNEDGKAAIAVESFSSSIFEAALA